ncbi:hypothetical protein O7602_26595 [Micromonospora sp. WMMD1128]|uniref:hypothetical protein n=1 Tax=Micromonospora sp. WMMD1128 TaxID=3015150 RepID=UPI00248C0B26|nr:hypothetical protein [Micromonospora sp. WMMD1128]WBB73213.1 hypothetical protein O7602_26595 [Micromonospora sp. WMMD1128]
MIPPEPPEHTLVVWFCPVYRRPWQVWWRDDTCTSDGRRWIEAHQYGQGTGVQPWSWPELCAELATLDGPHVLGVVSDEGVAR